MRLPKSFEASRRELRRELRFLDVFFMSLGGQAPFLSMLTYATAVLLLATYFAPIVVMVGTFVVLLNGVVVYWLSKKHTETGGYFNYAFKVLSRRLGFETGWVYAFYSALYGAGYLAGSVFILSYLLSTPLWLSLAVVFVPAALLLVMGIKPSTKYAIFAGSLEIGVLVAVVVSTLYISRFTLYNPFSSPPQPSSLLAGILFAIGIPTGYGAITPVSGEVKDAAKSVGRVAVSVILIGGSLEAMVLYGLVNVAIHTGSLSVLLGSQVPVIFIMRKFAGALSFPLLLFAGINDGILGSLSFMTALSRNLYAMSNRSLMPRAMGLVRTNGTPIVAAMVTIAATAAVLIPPLFFLAPFQLFLALGALAGLANLFVHISANISLVKSSMHQAGRRVPQLGLALAAAVISGFVLVYSLALSPNVMAALFVGYAALGLAVVMLTKSRGR